MITDRPAITEGAIKMIIVHHLRWAAFHFILGEMKTAVLPILGRAPGQVHVDAVGAGDFPQSPALSGRRCCAKAVIVRQG